MNSPSRGPAGYSVLGSHGTPISYVLSSSELSLEMRDHGYQPMVSEVLKPRIATFYDGKVDQTFNDLSIIVGFDEAPTTVP